MLRVIAHINPSILATLVALLAIALGLIVRRRFVSARLQRRRLAEQSAQTSTGETSVLPLAHLASAVEVLDLEDLLVGEDGSIAAAARRELEAPTDVVMAADTVMPLPPVIAGRVAGTAQRQATLAPAAAVVGHARPVPAMAGGAPATARPPTTPAMVGKAKERAVSSISGDAGVAATERAVPVRELALAWFEARGYRASTASLAVRPIELVLRHRKDPGRAYAFIVEHKKVTAERLAGLVEHAQSIGLTKVLVAAESGSDPGTRQLFRRQGVRLVDQQEMRREFDKLDLRVAAKIIAVARSRARLHNKSS